MTVPSYTEDLTDINSADTITNWAESADANWDDGGGPTSDADYPYIQGSVAVSQQMTKATICSLLYNNTTGITLPTDGAYFVWQNYSSPNGIDTLANGGMRVLVGSSLTAFKSWDVGGSDFGRNPYGGWMNHAVNTTLTADDTVGSPTATEQYIGAAIKATVGISKGNPHQVDMMRYGRGSSIFEFGETANYCIFSGFATQNDNTSNRWGLVQAIAGGYLYKGKMTLGTNTNAVDFRDSNVNILIDDTRKVTANFNTIEINHASSRVDWENIKITALGTVSPGRLICNANSDLNFNACQFTDMGVFTFGGTASTCTNAIWNECGQITAPGGSYINSQVLLSTVAADTGAFYWTVSTDPNTATEGMIFSKGTNAHHAIDFGTAITGNITLTNCAFNGFNTTTNDSNDAAVRFLATTGSLTLSLVGCTVDGVSATSSNFRIDDAAGIVVTLSIDPVTTLINVKDNLGVNLQNARVYLAAADGVGDLPYQETVTITRATTTATVSHTSHGMQSNEYINISGITDKTEDNHGAHQITVINANSYSYITTDSGSTTYTGTIVATGVTLYGLTDASGNISSSRTYGANQNVTGYVRKSSSSPRFKSFNLAGNQVNSASGLTINVRMVLDE